MLLFAMVPPRSSMPDERQHIGAIAWNGRSSDMHCEWFIHSGTGGNVHGGPAASAHEEIITSVRLQHEGRAMRHCVASYARTCARGAVAIFSSSTAEKDWIAD
jgi:hypothetical protein